ncbi:MAG: tRNA 2-thiouridine(34) synthase MnmA [Desulfonatronovibrio sp.]
MKTAVALSGGMDSLASLLMLHSSGNDLLPFHARFFPEKDTDTELNLKKICNDLGLRLHIIDLSQEFEQLIIRPFIDAYLSGLTPNPCALCNRKIKFGLIFDQIKTLGAEYLATGHYARMLDNNSKPSLWRGADSNKDQSYFLSLVPPDILGKIIFPLHQTTKKNAREYLSQKQISPPVRKESNEICFIENDYRSFIRSRLPSIPQQPGQIKTIQGKILGTHQGLWQYTQGQRRGLGIAHDYPLYVTGKDTKNNTLIVGSKNDTLTSTCQAGNLNIHIDPVQWPSEIVVQTRYRQKAGPASVDFDHDLMKIEFYNPQEIPAPGQVAAVYSAQGQVLAAGIIIQDQDTGYITA